MRSTRFLLDSGKEQLKFEEDAWEIEKSDVFWSDDDSEPGGASDSLSFINSYEM